MLVDSLLELSKSRALSAHYMAPLNSMLVTIEPAAANVHGLIDSGYLNATQQAAVLGFRDLAGRPTELSRALKSGMTMLRKYGMGSGWVTEVTRPTPTAVNSVYDAFEFSSFGRCKELTEWQFRSFVEKCNDDTPAG
ncbi:hypothetical protein AAVH_41299, partial [Aphelenchoides avenae]